MQQGCLVWFRRRIGYSVLAAQRKSGTTAAAAGGDLF